jgi:hypothetical protein
MGVREYDPATGTFITHDPASDPSVPNGYSYTSANPLGHTDPTGMFVPVGAVAGGALATGAGIGAATVGVAVAAVAVVAVGGWWAWHGGPRRAWRSATRGRLSERFFSRPSGRYSGSWAGSRLGLNATDGWTHSVRPGPANSPFDPTDPGDCCDGPGGDGWADGGGYRPGPRTGTTKPTPCNPTCSDPRDIGNLPPPPDSDSATNLEETGCAAGNHRGPCGSDIDVPTIDVTARPPTTTVPPVPDITIEQAGEGPGPADVPILEPIQQRVGDGECGYAVGKGDVGWGQLADVIWTADPDGGCGGDGTGRASAGSPSTPEDTAGPQAASPAGLWDPTSFAGSKVYQRDDLIDPNVVDARGRTNVERMERGLAPIGPDGEPINLHHMTQRQSGAVAEITATMHRAYSRILHTNPSTVPSGIIRSVFDAWKRNYWRFRACDFGGC